MRVIAGQAKGHRLAGPPSRATRPTSDLVRGAIFSALESMGVELTRVLDLYAGSGALGIEALSRGGQWCDFVEKDARSCASIRENLAKTRFDGLAKVHCAPVERALARLEGPYTLVLADPPYAQEAAPSLERLVESGLAEAGGTVLVLEHSSREEGPGRLGGLSQVKTLRHGDSAVSIYR
ncbi:MAG: RsmD family RNA methyltransferase [Chloroflexi bacterium]|nr:RsmD family RNA methyltransferase [Chloroflexota bacterium]